jgi:cytochrome c biogenesis protein CcmG/thiol:disulfide interchange protein DsbE
MVEAIPLRSTRGGLQSVGLVALLLAGLALLPRVFAGREASRVGQSAPDFRLPIVANGGEFGGDGAWLGLHDLRGRASVLVFWATWCMPCRAEAPIINEVSRRWHDRDVVVLGVNTDEPGQGDPRAFAFAHGLVYPILRDASAEAVRAYDVEALPTLVVISRIGKIVAIRTGVTGDGEIDRLIQQAL